MTAEDRLQAACVTWFRLQYPHLTLFAIPNGGKRSAITGAMLKKTGTLAGVADLFLMAPKYEQPMGIYTISHGLFIEMKVGKNKLTDSQRWFMTKAILQDYKYEICRSFDEFKSVIENYLT